MSDAFVETGGFATSRGKPRGEDVEFVLERLNKYPLTAISRMSGRSLAFVQQVAKMSGLPIARPRAEVESGPSATVEKQAAPRRKGTSHIRVENHWNKQWRRSLPPAARKAIEDVARAHGLTYGDLTLPSVFRGAQSVCEIRQEAYHALYEIRRPDGSRKFSLKQLGSWFGGRDHTTILSGVRAHERRLAGRAAACM